MKFIIELESIVIGKLGQEAADEGICFRISSAAHKGYAKYSMLNIESGILNSGIPKA